MRAGSALVPMPSMTTPELPAAAALNRVFGLLPAMIRLTCGLIGAAAALAVRTPPVHTPLLIVVTGVLTGWSVHFARRAWRDGLRPPLVHADLALTVAACLGMPVLVAPEVLPGEVSWLAVLASTSVIIAQLGLPARWSIPAGLLVAGSYAAGAHLAGNDQEAVTHAVTLLVQTASAAGLAYLMRRGSRRADAAFSSYRESLRRARVARDARDAERRQNRDLHDTVLSTLTIVGLGAAPADCPQLRERAAADLRALATLAEARGRDGEGPADRVVALDQRLRDVLVRLPEVPVRTALQPCTVPVEVADALADSTAAVLSNVARHAPGATATLRLARVGHTVVIEVTDDGPGFDPSTVPTHRYGLREAVHGRMAALPGRAEVHSVPGCGTRVRLEWTDAR